MKLTQCKRHKKQEDEDIEVDGGTNSTINNEAPKSIDSTDIVFFECEFGLDSYVLEETEDDDFNGFFRLSVKLVDGEVKGKYTHSTRWDRVDKEFTADKAFLTTLGQIVKEEEFAKTNGIVSRTSGLPDFFGSELTVDYATGEHIYSSDNQEILLPIDGLRKVKELFDEAINQDNWQCECGQKNHKDSDFCEKCGTPKPGVDPKDTSKLPKIDLLGDVPNNEENK